MLPSIIAVQRLPAANVKLFHERALKADSPCVLEGLSLTWPAIQLWSSDYLRSRFGEARLPISNYRDGGNPKTNLKPRMLMREYLDYVERAEGGDPAAQQPIYAAGWHYLKDCPEMAGDLKTPEQFRDNWIDRLEGVINFDQTSLFIGHRNAETPLHTDSFFVSTWLAMIRGTKVIRLIPAQYSGYVRNGLDTFDPSVVQELKRRDIPLYETRIAEGDAIFMPPGWWHQVRNESMTIAVSNNYVSAYHFLAFEQQVRAKILKPLLGLAALRDSALQAAGCCPDSFDGLRVSMKTLTSAHYVRNERQYAAYLRNQADRITKLLDHIETGGSET